MKPKYVGTQLFGIMQDTTYRVVERYNAEKDRVRYGVINEEHYIVIEDVVADHIHVLLTQLEGIEEERIYMKDERSGRTLHWTDCELEKGVWWE